MVSGEQYGEIQPMQSATDQIIQIRWHGRGGQGAITAELLEITTAMKAME